MRRLILLTVALFTCGVGCCQLKVGFRTGYGYYSQPELKGFQEEIRKGYPVEPRVTESFPSYWYYEGSVSYILQDKFDVGVSVAYGSSASRASYKDYSGEITNDLLAQYIAVGLPFDLKLNPDNPTWQFNLGITPAWVYSSLAISLHSRIGTQEDNVRYDFNSENITLQPNFTIVRRIGPLGLNLLAGYNVTVVKGELFLKHSDNYLQNDAGDKVRMDWSGLRLAFGLSYTFGSGRDKE